jgi:putative ABC transport system permease protein
MFDTDVWQEIFETIRKNKLRTFLTGFSVAWGIFMLMILLGSGNGLQNAVLYQFDSSTQNLIWLNCGETSMPYQGLKEGRRIRFTNDDYDFLKDKEGDIELISSHFYFPVPLVCSYKDSYGSFSISNCHPTVEIIEKNKVIEGRFINDLDIKEFRKVIVIGDGLRNALFRDEDPLDKYVKLNNLPYKVIGVFTNPHNSENKTGYIPFSTAQHIYQGGNRVGSMTVTTRMVKTVEEAEAIKQKLREQMALRHNFDPKDTRALGTYDRLSDYIRTMKIFQAIKIFIWIIGIGTLTAGIVGVSNIMLILVRERTREIGIRKALGATPSSIMGLVLLESVLITSVAGYTGLVLGTGIMEAVNWALERTTETGGNLFFRNPTVDFTTALVSTLLLVIAGSLAGYLPARKAATVKPVEALRDE